jgi:alpha-glucosidase
MRNVLLALIALVAAAPLQAAAALELRSPDGRNRVTLALDAGGRPTYTVSRDGGVLIAASPIGLELDEDRVGYAMRVAGDERTAADTRYAIVAGKAAEARDRHNQMTVHLVETGPRARRMDIVLRAYDDGVAFRTILPVQPRTAAALVRGEETEFRFPEAWRCWGLNLGKFGSSHEGEFDPVDTARTREHQLFDMPVTCDTGRAAFVLAEADLIDFAGLYLSGRGDGGMGFRARLSPSLDDPRVAVRSRIGSPIVTPWRVVMLADNAGALVGSTLLANLSTPSRIEDTSWIKPGKSLWDWWNGPTLKALPRAGSNTATAKAFIDFAAAQGFDYAMIDEGWYMGAGGGGLVRPGVDLTRWADDFDLPAVAAYARSKNVRLWLWANWRALDAQMEEALTLYARLGIAGIKVDFMDRDDQWMVNWYGKLLAAAARHRLMVNLHGAFAPRGLSRTYPNFVTQEGVMGAEYNKWSRRITAEHNVMLAYTRGLLGPMDYTPGGFRNVAPAAFEARNNLPYVQTTRAHGLAMYVVYESPLAIVSDSPDTYAASPAGLDFIRAVPTKWDETRFVGGRIGESIAVARRSGARWFVGAMNGAAARTLPITLDFLPAGRFRMRSWADGTAPDRIVATTRTVAAGETITLTASPAGGAVLIVEPE